MRNPFCDITQLGESIIFRTKGLFRKGWPMALCEVFTSKFTVILNLCKNPCLVHIFSPLNSICIMLHKKSSCGAKVIVHLSEVFLHLA